MPHAANWFVSGKHAAAPRQRASQHRALRQVPRAATREIFLGVANDAQFRKLCECIARPDLAADPRFATNAATGRKSRGAASPRSSSVLAAHEAERAVPRPDARGRSGGPGATPCREAFCAGARRASRHDGRRRKLPRRRLAGAALGDTPAHARAKPPRFAEHADEILAEAGYTADEIAELRHKDVVRQRSAAPLEHSTSQGGNLMKFVRMLAALAAGLVLASHAVAQAYPNKPVAHHRRVPGRARHRRRHPLHRRAPQPGARPELRRRQQARRRRQHRDRDRGRAAPDGYTLTMGTNATHGTNQFLYDTLPFDAGEATSSPSILIGSFPDGDRGQSVVPGQLDRRRHRDRQDARPRASTSRCPARRRASCSSS